MEEERKKKLEEEEVIDNIKEETIQESLKYYDSIILFESFYQLLGKNGWKIYWKNQNSKKKYNDNKEKKNIVVGVIGNKNRGKSYFLQRLIKEGKNKEKMSGFNITTYGISVNYPDEEDIKKARNFIILDIAGKENPLLESSITKHYFKNEKLKDKINEILNDQTICEKILSNFIFEKSDILLVVIEQLSYVEQKMLSDLIANINKIDKKKINLHKIFVIHNLFNLRSKSEIEYYIFNVLKKSITFKLKERNMQTFHTNLEEKTYNTYFQDDNLSHKNILIEHYIFGYDIQKENEEVRTFFNNPVIEHIQQAIRTTSYNHIFDLNEEFYQYLEKECKLYIESSKIKLEKTDEFIKSENKMNELTLKPQIINKNGFLDFKLDEPIYSYEIYQDEEDNKYYLEVIIELPQKLTIQSKIIKSVDAFQIEINGKKEKEENKTKEEKDDNFPKDIYYEKFYIIIEISREFEINEGGFFGFFVRKKIYKIQNIKEIKEEKNRLFIDEEYQLYHLTFEVNFFNNLT